MVTPLDYLDRVPRKLPLGKALVHNRVHALWENQTPGINGFRAWTVTRLQAAKNKAHVKCSCGWSGLPHYRVPALGDQADPYGPPPSVKGKRLSKAELEDWK
jgi:hypothetical protein